MEQNILKHVATKHLGRISTKEMAAAMACAEQLDPHFQPMSGAGAQHPATGRPSDQRVNEALVGSGNRIGGLLAHNLVTGETPQFSSGPSAHRGSTYRAPTVFAGQVGELLREVAELSRYLEDDSIRGGHNAAASRDILLQRKHGQRAALNELELLAAIAESA